MQTSEKKHLSAALALACSMLLLGACSGEKVSNAVSDGVEAIVPSAQAHDHSTTEEISEAEKKNNNFVNRLSDDKLLSALRSGGYVVFIRHGETEKDYADQALKTMNVNDCSTQRTLSEKGWNQSKTIGAAFKSGAIPVGKVISSQYCRAWQTADLAFGKFKKDSALNFAPAEDYTDAQMKSMKSGIMPYLTTAPEKGTNNIVVGHDDVFEAATGIYPAPQGISYVVKPKGDGFELLAKLSPLDWNRLAK